MARTKIRLMLDESCRDYTHWRSKGWFAADYFYPVHLSPLKKAAGRLFDYNAARSVGHHV